MGSVSAKRTYALQTVL